METGSIDQFRYIKIQPKTIDLSTRLRGIKPHKLCIYSPEPRTEVFCFRLNFNISEYIEEVLAQFSSSGENQPIDENGAVLMQTELRFYGSTGLSSTQKVAYVSLFGPPLARLYDSNNTNVSCLSGCEMTHFCYMTRSIIHCVQDHE